MPGNAAHTDKPVPHVDIALDIACVWSYLGYSRFARAAAKHRANGNTVDVAFRPFQVAPNASTSGEPLTEVHKRDLGPDAEDKIAHVRALANADGLALNFDRAVFANTFEAHRLIALAAQQGKAEAMVERLFRAYFVDGRNVADTHTLHELAADVGLAWNDDGADAVRTELRHTRDDNITTVPRFAVEGGPVLTGLQSEQALLDAVATAVPAQDT